MKDGTIFRTYPVNGAEGGLRLDVFLTRQRTDLSRARLQRLIDEGRVAIGGITAIRASQKLRAGDVVALEEPQAVPLGLVPQEIPLSILYEDHDLLVLDKPAGLVVHPAAGHAEGTLVNALLYHCRDLSGIGGVLRPGIVHRLDKDTSGLLVVAKTDLAHSGLAAQFKRHQVGKTYFALVYGDPREDQGLIDLPVGRHPVERKKMSTKSRRGKEAITSWKIAERFGVAALLSVDIKTGRTHQIRVHLAAMGHPVVGDPVYGGSRRLSAIGDPVIKTLLKGMDRQALHAARLSFVHPGTGRTMEFYAPPPPDIAELCTFLREHGAARA
ncbi:ribosomal large subunit pseudouridine synthase D [Syntrophus gentianae]|uniref:Pseudouridine synthase n=1 Tax=Syntrophus gentianae TaxID=43775 RepID=A0A1H7UGD3_9BACT|nr:RluA family pseudouridine synthase [Syntrophus gentianae]SEL95869.1 ribosomal large subunit pseudouridine synthase D [Syntrophus gentianae]